MHARPGAVARVRCFFLHVYNLHICILYAYSINIDIIFRRSDNIKLMILKKHACNVSVSSSSRSLISFFHLGKVKNSGPSDVPSLPWTIKLHLEVLHVFFPLQTLLNKHHPQKKIRSFFYLKFFFVARSENVAFYRSGSPKKMRPACQLASASALIAAFLARNSRFWASSKDSPCCLPHLFDRKKTTKNRRRFHLKPLTTKNLQTRSNKLFF